MIPGKVILATSLSAWLVVCMGALLFKELNDPNKYGSYKIIVLEEHTYLVIDETVAVHSETCSKCKEERSKVTTEQIDVNGKKYTIFISNSEVIDIKDEETKP